MIDFSQIDYKSPTFLKIVGTVVLFFLILYLWNSMSYKPNKEVIQQKQEQLEKLRRDIQTAKRAAKNIDKLEAELKRLFTQYKLVEELLPGKRDLTDFLKKIDLVAKQSDAKLVKIEQKPSQQVGYYYEDPYNIQIKTTFHGLGKFLSLVANLPFTALVRDIKITRANEKKYSINVSMTIVAHHMKSEQRIYKIEELKKKKPGAKKKKKIRRKAKKVPS
ncbi:MAG TPA: hypothetical protein ENG11_00480 [candidate division Zixibacteria bacterium]|nr:hypothetical protein [candidate division Zixibacteria bacterium]